MIRKNSHLRIGRYHQHLHELLDLDMSPLDYMMKAFPEVKEREEMRKIIGRYGLTGRQQVHQNLLSASFEKRHFRTYDILFLSDLSYSPTVRWSTLSSRIRLAGLASASSIATR